jgi:hypothetical protein
MRFLGASWYCVWLDGNFLLEGPLRYPAKHPEYQELSIELSAGEHILAAKVAYFGASTRLLADLPPFLAAMALVDDQELPITWRCLELPGNIRTGRRINGQLGWVEYWDTRQTPAGWRAVEYDDSAWHAAVSVLPQLGVPQANSIGAVQNFRMQADLLAKGALAEHFGYNLDDPPLQFFLRDLEARTNPPQGIWRRYDLGRVRLARPDFKMKLPRGAMVQFAYSEALHQGRVLPWITLSCGQSCNMDLFIARGGIQDFCPLQPKGGRFVELHLLGVTEDQAEFMREDFIERGYHAANQGEFTCDDTLLNTIWQVGVETYRACTEDAVIDNPTRERGQWTGDVVSVGMDIASAAYADLRLIHRGLVQSAQCARADGLVAGLCPGGAHYHPSYSAQWVNACLHYWELTGERQLLEQMWPNAQRNIAAFEQYMSPEGIIDAIGHIFIDWGYARNEGPADIAFNLHYYAALCAMKRWALELRKTAEHAHYSALALTMKNLLTNWLETHLNGLKTDWIGIGYHTTALAMANGLVSPKHEKAALNYLKQHIQECFPNDVQAPRNAAPEVAQPRLITPYFAHYAFPVLIERGEMDFVLDQYRRCWGWALESGRTTWVEVFDTRWTHCHQWAGCPTWQLTRYVLGLHTRYDLGCNHFNLKLISGSLTRAGGKLPLPNGNGNIDISWRKECDRVVYSIATPEPIWLHIDNASESIGYPAIHYVEQTAELELDAREPKCACSAI